jgi:hypothetical protein
VVGCTGSAPEPNGLSNGLLSLPAASRRSFSRIRSGSQSRRPRRPRRSRRSRNHPSRSGRAVATPHPRTGWRQCTQARKSELDDLGKW